MQKKEELNNNKGKEFLVITKYPKDYKIFDERSNKPVCYQENEDASMVLQEIDTISCKTRIDGHKNNLDYFAPNNIGILLSISTKSLLRAEKIYDGYLNPDKVNHLKGLENKDKKENIIIKSKIVYDYIESVQSAIVFGYTALEAFSNISIPENYLYKPEKSSKGIVEIYDKEAIERWIPLKTKIGEILVDVYKTKNIKLTNLWNQFLQVEEFRNEIIHQKTINSTDFYKKYFKKDFFELCKIFELIIKFYFNERENKTMTNPIWPWVINTENEFPVSKNYNPANFEVKGNIYEGRNK